MQRKIIVNNLKEAGIQQIESVEDDQAALKELQRFMPDLIISSIYFENRTVVDLIQTINRLQKETTSVSHEPLFMVISSETRLQALDPIRQAGVIAILPKPFERQELERALINTLDYLDLDEIDLETYDPNSMRVLVVDDSSTARNFICKTLQKLGIQQLTQVNSGKKAIETLNEQSFDLIVTDYNMPEMDGKALTEFVRTNTELTHIPILMVTSEKSQAVLSGIYQVGVSAICSKPFEVNQVRDLLTKIMN